MKTLGVVLLVVLLTGCAAKTNKAKCDSIGGTYNQATRSCQLQAE